MGPLQININSKQLYKLWPFRFCCHQCIHADTLKVTWSHPIILIQFIIIQLTENHSSVDIIGHLSECGSLTDCQTHALVNNDNSERREFIISSRGNLLFLNSFGQGKCTFDCQSGKFKTYDSGNHVSTTSCMLRTEKLITFNMTCNSCMWTFHSRISICFSCMYN